MAAQTYPQMAQGPHNGYDQPYGYPPQGPVQQMDHHHASQPPPGPFPGCGQPQQLHSSPGEISTAVTCTNCEIGMVPGDTAHHAGASYFCQSCARHVPPNAQQVQLHLSAHTPSRENGSTQCDSCMREIKKGKLAWYCSSCFMSKKLCEKCWRKKRKHCRHVRRGEVQMVTIDKMSGGNKATIAKVVGKVVGQALASG